MEHLPALSAFDRFSYPEQPILFFFVSDPECAKQRNLEEGAIVMYMDSSRDPFVF